MSTHGDLFIACNRAGSAPVSHFQVFGERRSGTNFAEQLFERNLTAKRVDSYGWKHGVPAMPFIQHDGLIVVVIREAFDWLGSLHNRPFAASHGDLEFSEFLRREWYEKYRPGHFGHKDRFGKIAKGPEVANQVDRHPITGKRFRNVLELRTVKAQAFLGFVNRECNAVVLRYSDLSKRPGEVVTAVAETFGMALKTPEVKPVERVGPKGFSEKRLRKEDLSAEDIAFVQENLDRDFELEMGFASTFA